MVDASGNRIIDASANAIIEAGIPVYVSSYGLLSNVRQQGGGIPEVPDWLEIAVELIEEMGIGPQIQQLANMHQASLDNFKLLVSVVSDAQELYADKNLATYQGFTLTELLDRIDGIASGGLTQDEHDRLYGIPLTGLSASDVWNAVLQTTWRGIQNFDVTAALLLQAAGVYADMAQAYVGFIIPGNPDFSIYGELPWIHSLAHSNYENPSNVELPSPIDWSAWQDGDDMLTFLLRTQPDHSWTYVPAQGNMLGGGVGYYRAYPYGYWVVCNVTKTQEAPAASLTEGSGLQLEVNVGNVPPVWPGAASVTLGTPVALANHLVVTDDMDGVIVAVTTPPQKLGRYQIGSQTYDYGVGRIAFATDSGDLEGWQYLGFRAGIFTPRTMKRAAACHLQVLGGAEGTITPWTVS